MHEFSQLPVMSSEREVKGIVSSKSIARCLMKSPVLDGEVREYMEALAFELNIDSPLLEAIGEICHHEYALIRDKGKISGIVTVSDLSGQFMQLTQPFLFLRQIENHLRELIQDRMPGEAFTHCIKQSGIDNGKENNKSVFDLDFGDYLRLLSNKEKWERLGLSADRNVFVSQLDRVRKVRNEIMHFDPDGITSEELNALQEFASFLRCLEGPRS